MKTFVDQALQVCEQYFFKEGLKKLYADTTLCINGYFAGEGKENYKVK